MIGALFSGISGLNSFQSALDTESHNISNVNTVGFKSDQISFSDMMYQKSVGMGVNSEVIDKNFKQGSLKNTGAAYDMAIQGKGFFMVKGNSAEIQYTRAGNFRMAADGTLQMPNGYVVQGIGSKITNTNATDPNATLFSNEYSNFIASKVITLDNNAGIENINIKTTNYNLTATNDDMSSPSSNYKTKAAKISDIELLISSYNTQLDIYSSNQTAGTTATKQKSEISFDINKVNGNNSSIEIIIDNNKIIQNFELNSQNTMDLLTNKISNIQGLNANIDNNGNLSVSSIVPGKEVKISDAKVVNLLTKEVSNAKIETTKAQSGSGKLKLDAIESELKLAVENADAKYLKQSTSIDSTSTQIGDIQLKLDTLGYSDTPFGTPEIVDGVIYMTQGQNKFAVAKVPTSEFISEQELNPQGGNLFSATLDSGEAIMVTDKNNIVSNTLELSNSDLSKNLVNLMVFQRSFEASSKSITTSDEFLKTALALKK